MAKGTLFIERNFPKKIVEKLGKTSPKKNESFREGNYWFPGFDLTTLLHLCTSMLEESKKNIHKTHKIWNAWESICLNSGWVWLGGERARFFFATTTLLLLSISEEKLAQENIASHARRKKASNTHTRKRRRSNKTARKEASLFFSLWDGVGESGHNIHSRRWWEKK